MNAADLARHAARDARNANAARNYPRAAALAVLAAALYAARAAGKGVKP